MKVVQINEYCGTGSTGRICLQLAQMLEEKGHECKIAYGRKQTTEDAEEYGIRMTGALGVRIHGIETRIFDNHAFASTMETKKLVRFLKKYKPDVIHLHNLHGYYLNVAVLFHYIAEHNIPIMWTLHDCWTMTGHCSHFYQIGCNRWMTGCHDCPQKKEYPASIVVDGSKRNWRKKKEIFTGIDRERAVIVTPSAWLAGLAEKSYLNKYQIKVIPNGISLDVFYPRENHIFDKKFGDKKIVLGVANIWTENKGIYEFLRLAELLDKSEYQMVLVGEVEKGLPIPSDIYRIDRTDSVAELAEIYSGADVYVNLSKVETQGMTTIEALACGCPVVIYEAGGSSESVNEHCGRVVDSGDLSLVVNAIEEMTKQDRKMLQDCCVQQAGRFNKQKMVEEYYLLYEKVIRKRNE